MNRTGFLGLAAVAVVALALAAASLGSVAVTIDPGGQGDQPPAPDESSGCITDPDQNTTNDSGSGEGECQNSGQRSEGGLDLEYADDGFAPGTEQSGEPPLWQVLLSLGLVVVGGVAVVYGLTGGDEVESAAEPTAETHTSTHPQHRVTFAADVAPTNDVFRAWLALQRAVDAETVSPATVAARAVDAGHPEEAVDGLTELFCAVRYGDAEPTPEHERRAREFATTLELTLPTEGHQ